MKCWVLSELCNIQVKPTIWRFVPSCCQSLRILAALHFAFSDLSLYFTIKFQSLFAHLHPIAFCALVANRACSKRPSHDLRRRFAPVGPPVVEFSRIIPKQIRAGLKIHLSNICFLIPARLFEF